MYFCCSLSFILSLIFDFRYSFRVPVLSVACVGGHVAARPVDTVAYFVRFGVFIFAVCFRGFVLSIQFPDSSVFILNYCFCVASVSHELSLEACV